MSNDESSAIVAELKRIAAALEAQNESIKRITFAAEQLERFRVWIDRHVDRASKESEVRP